MADACPVGLHGQLSCHPTTEGTKGKGKGVSTQQRVLAISLFKEATKGCHLGRRRRACMKCNVRVVAHHWRFSLRQNGQLAVVVGHRGFASAVMDSRFEFEFEFGFGLSLSLCLHLAFVRLPRPPPLGVCGATAPSILAHYCE